VGHDSSTPEGSFACHSTHAKLRHDPFICVIWLDSPICVYTYIFIFMIDLHVTAYTHVQADKDVDRDHISCITLRMTPRIAFRSICMCHVTRGSESRHTLEWVMSHVWIIHTQLQACKGIDKVTTCMYVCCSVLQCVAECCCVLLCVAVCCSVTPPGGQRCQHARQLAYVCVTLCYSVLQCVQVFCSVLLRVVAWCVAVWHLQAGKSIDKLYNLHALCWSVLQCVAVCFNVLQYVAVWHLQKGKGVNKLHSLHVCVLQCAAACCNALKCVEVCCSALQCIAACCSVLQCVAVCCSVLQCDTCKRAKASTSSTTCMKSLLSHGCARHLWVSH